MSCARKIVADAVAMMVLCLVVVAPPLQAETIPVAAETTSRQPLDLAKILKQGDYCIDCHRLETPGLYEQWVNSTHARFQIGCLDCHGVSQHAPEAHLHAERFYIRIAVSPAQCSRCHRETGLEAQEDAHSRALLNLEEMPPEDPRYPILAPYRENGFAECASCHGSRVRLEIDRVPAAATWPNSGAGRINPDGTSGNCASCHQGHGFSVADVRRPEACLGCHDGRNYPEGSIFLHSPHGLTFSAKGNEAPLSTPGFYLDASRYPAPTCALCHYNGAGKGLVTTHRPETRLANILTQPELPARENFEERRQAMTGVCSQCHAASVASRFLEEADRRLGEYQITTVQPELERFQKQLEKTKGKDRDKLLEKLSSFLRDVKEYRMSLYMGEHGRRER